jgi:hypothetical protein
MKSYRTSLLRSLLLVFSVAQCSNVIAASSYLLKANLPPGSTSHVIVKVEVGGDRLMPTEQEIKKVPIKVVGNFDFREQIVAWSSDAKTVARSIRQYKAATAKYELEGETTDRTLPEDRRLLLSEIRDGLSNITGAEAKLTREQFDFVNEVANPLAIDRLLPGREMAEGETWTHDEATLGPLLGMDHVAVCDVSSVVTSESQRQVQIRLAGTVHGTIDGTPTEYELRAAYLFHLDHKRITRFNLAIKEVRKQSDLNPGLDVVAKAFVAIDPERKQLEIPTKVLTIAKQIGTPLSRTLVYESATKSFRFEYDAAWYIRGEERGLLSLRYLRDHEVAAHCTVTVLPARSAGRHTPLDEFERDVRQTLTDKLDSISAATEWETPRGNHCLGVIAEGKVNDLPIQWRNYLVSADDCPRLSLSVTLERNRSETFADADRQIIDSVELIPTPPAVTANAGTGKVSR